MTLGIKSHANSHLE